ncbi:hypothetical protein [Nocardioides taihuensis]|uniref:Uncharacterized protein n=1 Tax=Nocardioides taihuensis TaxID=1835606 RepID=A0ABW0BKS6_9ACTN
MSPSQAAACGVAAVVMAVPFGVSAPGQDVASGVRCVLTRDARLDELESVGGAAVAGLRSVRGPERVSHCTSLPDVAVTWYVQGDPAHPGRWRSAVAERVAERVADSSVGADGDYEVTTGYPVRTRTGHELPVTVWFSGHPRYQPAD